MKIVAIITLNGYINYGNRLQNFALQSIMEEYGFYVETIWVDQTKITTKLSFIDKIRYIGKKSIYDIFLKISNKLWVVFHCDEVNMAYSIRTEMFKKFTEDYIKETEFYISDESIPNDLASKYDYFIVGSDQVWNPQFTFGSPIYFLTFAPKEKRIAYSASFGIDAIPPEYEARFKEWIEGMNCLSVREEAGAKIISKLTGREAVVLVDPTMMLDKNDWLKISKESIYKPTKKFLCTYFLGSTYDLHKNEITKISVDNDLELVNLGSLYDLKRYSEGPSEFLDYIASCELFLTDSFHGAIFSILFNKPFIVFDRIGNMPSMSSRIETLLSKFKLEHRKWERVMETGNYFEVDFSHVKPILEKERKKAYEYLKNALKIKD